MKTFRALLSSGAFASRWYRQEYADVAMSGMTPEEHYLWIGRALNRKGAPDRAPRSPTAPLRWCVMTTMHTLFLADMVASNLRRHGWMAEVVTDAPESFLHDYYIVLCPQMFERLPPGERRLCYQLEQSVSSRWFTPEYFNILENSAAVLDYSLTISSFLPVMGFVYPHVFYMPIGAVDLRAEDRVSNLNHTTFFSTVIIRATPVGDGSWKDWMKNITSVSSTIYSGVTCKVSSVRQNSF